MQLEQLLDRVEDAAHRVRLGLAGDLLDLAVRHQVEVELRPHALEHLREVQRADVRRSRVRSAASISERRIGASWRERNGKPSWMITAARSD